MLYNSLQDWMLVVLAVVLTFVVAFIFTPSVIKFAVSIGAIDKPGNRRIHKVPIPRMGGIAIVSAFLFGVLLFVPVEGKTKGLILGAMIIALMGGIDDIVNLRAWIKLVLQIVAAIVAVHYGVVLDGVTSLFGKTVFVNDIIASVLTVIWIVACTNAVNLIDGLDGLACSISAISAFTMMIVSIMVSDLSVTILLACLFGACAGFLPYNRNPAKIFMGDVGSQTLGFILATVSTIGLFKMHAAVTFLVPLFALAVPLADTAFAIIRRLLKGQSPFKADKGHFHHRLLALGLNQRQVVGILSGITFIMGLISILMTGSNAVLKTTCTVALFVVALFMWISVTKKGPASKADRQKFSETEPDVKIYSDVQKKTSNTEGENTK